MELLPKRELRDEDAGLSYRVLMPAQGQQTVDPKLAGSHVQLFES
jgi:hypothetical protein